MKYHPPTAIGLTGLSGSDVLDAFLTDEWVGSGGSAYRLTLFSERLVGFIDSKGWRGLTFRAASVGGQSERVT